MKMSKCPEMSDKVNMIASRQDDNNIAAAVSAPKGLWIFSARFLITALLCFGIFVGGICRTNVSMSMVCMINYTAIDLLRKGESLTVNDSNLSLQTNITNGSTAGETLRAKVKTSSEGCTFKTWERAEYDGDLIWGPTEQKWIFAALHIGQLVTILPAGHLADRFGPKRLLFCSIAVSLIATLLTPIAAKKSYEIFVGLRIIMGLFQAFMTPCIAATVARWIPPDEKGTVSGLYTAGNQISVIIGMPLFAWLCSLHDVIGGWPLIFYISGAIGLPWCILWLVFASNKPDSSKIITKHEKEYIAYCLRDQSLRSRKNNKVPWKAILMSPPVWALNVTLVAAAFGINALSNYLPKYFKDVLYLDVKKNGLFTALPYVSLLIIKAAMGYAHDIIKQKTKLSRTVICKIFNSLACFGLAGFLTGMSFLGCHHSVLAIVLLCAGMGLSSGYLAGARMCIHFMAPQYAGTITGLTSFLMMLAAIAAPYVVSPVTASGTKESWQIIFFSISIFLVVGGVVFIVFGSADLQDWAKAPDEQNAAVTSVPLIVQKDKMAIDGADLVVKS